ncbi:hypothetical protein FVR03_01320 [Pontibacter qinzhouensis]|uniref:Major capsid protein n=1 Tax=Pontibacter qinzhouensis TaxID=2603253 RepID=A0A5C8KB22_9BACT|nr:major capsid protein [Pontibacter qinzhouensis]TXK52384.1 hypothetical protein FVR03_01320 [Pontibacter qinzhouensis]
MTTSAYIQWVNKYFAALVLAQVARVNDTTNPLTYLHRQLLRPEFSVSGTWKSLSMNNNLVAADIVAMDSPLPLKKRGSLGSATGEIAKMGMEFQLNETQLTEIDTMIAMNTPEAAIVRYLFQDLPNAITGIYERLEFMFLEGLSTGVTVATDVNNVGTGIRMDYGYLAANKFEATTSFDDPDSLPMDQIKVMLDKASLDGNRITTIYTDPTTLANIAKSNQVKQYFAFLSGFTGGNVPVLDSDQVNQVMQRRFGFQFVAVDRSIRLQRNGINTPVKPWKAGTMVAVTTNQLGAYVWARLAEMTRPVEGVTYTTADGFILASQFRVNRPSLAEFINAQARVVPVISGVEAIYTFDTTTDTPAG